MCWISRTEAGRYKTEDRYCKTKDNNYRTRGRDWRDKDRLVKKEDETRVARARDQLKRNQGPVIH